MTLQMIGLPFLEQVPVYVVLFRVFFFHLKTTGFKFFLIHYIFFFVFYFFGRKICATLVFRVSCF